jgi:TatD DNase family protein
VIADAHAHLDMAQFDPDRAQVIDRAKAAGLKYVINVCLLGEGLTQGLALAEAHGFIHAVVGRHPHEAKGFSPDEISALEKYAAHPKVVGLGEMGLDFHYDLSPRPIQEEAFAAQLDLARRLDLPAVIHCREAAARTMEIITASGVRRGMFHCFSGDVALARQVLDLGLYLSIPGVVTYPKATTLHEVVAFAPLGRLLVETDCPYLAPVPHRGKRNEPSYVVLTGRAVAKIKKVGDEEVAAQTTANLERLLGLPR